MKSTRLRHAVPASLIVSAFLIVNSGTLLAETGAPSAPGASSWWPTAAIDKALSYIRLRYDDLALRDDYVARDSCRLTLVDSMMRRPDQMPLVLESTAGTLFGGGGSMSQTEVPLEALATLAVGNTLLDPDIVAIPTPASLSNEMARWSPAWQAFMERVGTQLSNSNWQDTLLRELSADDRRFVMEHTTLLVLEDESDKDKSAELLDSLQRIEDGYAVRFAALAGKLDWAQIYQARAPVIADLIHDIPSKPPPSLQEIMIVDTEFGRVLIGTPGADVFAGAAALIIDPGGDDRYELSSLGIGENRLILDYGGSDEYSGNGQFTYGAAQFGWGVLVDFQGDDLYRTGHFSLGCGWFGIGVSLDLDGRDIYIGDICSQGAGGFGLGLCMDRGGDVDQYTARLFSQGFGFVAGVGVLADDGGNDLYYVGGKYEDVLRYRDHYLSLGQGFGYGIRPHLSGGIGLLMDAAGNDVYSADIFGQGCSYWWSFGGLYDGGGNDQYVAYQYAQGSATHLTAGCLLDIAGDDRYEAKGVSQGCGHDWAPGYLIDVAGNDRYSATDLSQAAGSANGVGVLVDMAGNDGYHVTSDVNTQGYGNPRRDYGSIGLFLDMGGTDRYSGPGSDRSIWLSPSRWGVGVDADSTWLPGDTAQAEVQ